MMQSRSVRSRLAMLAAITVACLQWPSGAAPQNDPTPIKPSAKPPTPTTFPVATPDENADMSMRSPAQELAALEIAPGYHLELIASDPDVVCPTVCVWDGNGRMYVTEFRSYMLDIDAGKEKEPVSRVSVWESTKGDGKYDKHTIFADNLLLPRMLLPLDERIIIRETDTKDLFTYRDTKGVGTADEKVKIFEGGPQEGNLEHQPSGLTWNLDNWMYITHDSTRFRFTHGKIETHKMAYSAGQWGMAMDDVGHLILSSAGNELPAHDFQANWQYGKLQMAGELAANFNDVFPMIRLTDVEGGVKRLKPTGGLNHFTGCAGPSIYRGDALPQDLYGDYILPEPVGRFIRRAKINVVDGKMIISNPSPGKEFIASRDPNFRPVWSATGPDGCLYICDMYHGIIQEGNWTKQGSYLRTQILKYGLDKNINGGRIWRLVHDGMKPRATQPHMLDEKPAELVQHLSDPNGWWRDTAQRLIIVRGDKSVVPALKELASKSPNPIARLHALWTLDGLDSADTDFIREKMNDQDARIRVAAMRIAEPHLLISDPTAKTQPKENGPMMTAFNAMASDPDPTVANQYVLSIRYVKHPDADKLIADAIAMRETAKLSVTTQKLIAKAWADSVAEAKANALKQKMLALKDPALAKVWAKGRENYLQTCIACHGEDGKGAPTPEKNGTLAPSLAGSKKLQGDRALVCRIVLHGLVGPNDGGKTYPGEMASLKVLDDQWLSSILTYARNDFGNRGSMIAPADVAKVRKETETRDRPFTLQELIQMNLWTTNGTPPATQPVEKTAAK